MRLGFRRILRRENLTASIIMIMAHYGLWNGRIIPEQQWNDIG